MESISNSLSGGNILLSQMQSNSALNKVAAEKASEQQAAGAGNILESFGDMLQKQMSDINSLQSQADEAVQTYATGGEIELHNVILATEKADMALQLALQVRNRVLSAYQEITRMGI